MNEKKGNQKQNQSNEKRKIIEDAKFQWLETPFALSMSTVKLNVLVVVVIEIENQNIKRNNSHSSKTLSGHN